MFAVTRVDVFNIQIEQSSCTIFGQKRFIRFTKLLLPHTSVHAYSPEQSPIVFLQLLYKFSRLALNIKSELFTHLFRMSSSRSRNQRSQRRSRLNESSHCVCLTVLGWIILQTTHITKHLDQNNCRSLIEATKHNFNATDWENLPFVVENMSRGFCL